MVFVVYETIARIKCVIHSVLYRVLHIIQDMQGVMPR